ncbi:MAG: hypothetical protein OXD01_02490 [Gammaproteobacteria bacterium]|nr:hypothetical protein [Gammaproteobacteria bacterium]
MIPSMRQISIDLTLAALHEVRMLRADHAAEEGRSLLVRGLQGLLHRAHGHAA